MKRNGQKRRSEFEQASALVAEWQVTPAPTRAGYLAWLRQWRQRPARVFWLLDPDSGAWRQL